MSEPRLCACGRPIDAGRSKITGGGYHARCLICETTLDLSSLPHIPSPARTPTVGECWKCGRRKRLAADDLCMACYQSRRRRKMQKAS